MLDESTRNAILRLAAEGHGTRAFSKALGITDLRDGRQNAPLTKRASRAQRLVAKVQLPQLQFHRRRGRQQHAPALGFRVPRASPPDSCEQSSTCHHISSFATPTSTLPKAPRNPAPCAPNSSFARSQGSRVSGGGTRGGAPRGSAALRAIRFAIAYSG